MDATKNSRTYTVPEGHEFAVHFNVGSLILLQGDAKIMGAPMSRNTRFNFEGKGIPVVAHGGAARIEVSGDYTAKQPQVAVGGAAEIHAQLQCKRDDALEDKGLKGPRVLVVGEADTGKSSLCRTLINSAVSSGDGYGVSFVDVDVGQTAVSIPGCIGSAFITGPIAIDDEFSHVSPLGFFFGDKTVPGKFKGRYLDVCSYINECIQSVAAAQDGFRSGGIVVNTMGWVHDLGYSIAQQLIDVFRITDIVVTGGNDDLLKALQDDCAASGANVRFHEYRLPPTLYTRSKSVRTAARSRELLKYFIGTKRTPLAPCRLCVSIKDVSFVDAMSFEELQPSDIKPLQVAAISHAPHVSAVQSANVAGFVVILEVSRTQITLLTPSPGPLPRNILLVSPTITMEKADVPQVM